MPQQQRTSKPLSHDILPPFWKRGHTDGLARRETGRQKLFQFTAITTSPLRSHIPLLRGVPPIKVCIHSSPVTPGVHSLPPVYSWACSSLHSYNPKHHHQIRFFVGPVCTIILPSLKHRLTHRALHPGHQPFFSFIRGQGHRRNSPSILLWALHCRDSKQKKMKTCETVLEEYILPSSA